MSEIAWCRWLTPVILGTLEAKIRKIEVRSQLQGNSSRDRILRKLITEKGW
jgi:hypothetical protein